MAEDSLPNPAAIPTPTPLQQPEQLVNVRDPDTLQIGSLPVSQLAQAQQQGFIPVTNDEVRKDLNAEKYGTFGQMAKTAVEGGLEAATFGLSTAVETGLGIATPEDIQGRREENPISHGIGQAAGLVGSAALLPGAGAAGLIERAGLGAGKVLGLGAEAAIAESANAARLAGLTAREASAVAQATAGQAFSTGARVASAGLKGAAEMMLLQSGNEVSKAFSEDPHQSVGSVITDIGLSGLLGAGAGAATKGVSDLWRARKGDLTTSALNDLLNKASNGSEMNAMLAGMEPAERAAFLDASKVSAEQAARTAGQAEMSGEAQGFLGEVRRLKSNSDEISEAVRRLAPGEKPTPGMLSDSELIQHTENDMTKRGTLAGISRANQIKRIDDALVEKSQSLLADASVEDSHKVGTEIQKGLQNWVDERQKHFSETFNELRNDFGKMDIGLSTRESTVNDFLNSGTLNVAPDSDAAKIASRLAGNMRNLENVGQVMDLRTQVNGELGKAYRAADGPAIQVLNRAKTALTELREQGIKLATESSGIGEEAGAISAERIAAIRRADAEYGQFKTKLREMGRQSGIGKNISGTRDLAEKLADKSTESWATRIFDSKDLDSVNFFKNEFPAEFEKARQYKLGEILDAAQSKAQGENGRFRVGTFLREVDKIENPQVREMLFGQNSPRALDDLQTVFRAIPGNSDKLGSGGYISRMSMFTPEGALLNITDGLKYALSEMIPHLQTATGGSREAVELAGLMAIKSGAPIEPTAFKKLVEYAQSTIKGQTQLSVAAKEIFSAGPMVTGAKITEASREKLDQKLKALRDDPTPLFEVGGGAGHYAPEHGSAMAQTAVQAVNYLNSIRPVPVKKNPLDSEVPLSTSEKAGFNRALDLAQHPLLIMNDIKNGSVAMSDMKTIQTLYPGFYSGASQKLQSEMIDHINRGETVPYKVRLGLAAFLGQELDSTMSPQSILAAQPRSKESLQAPSMPSPGGNGRSLKSLDKTAGQYQTPAQAREAHRGQRP